MQHIVILSTNRSEYDIRDAAKYSMTVGELISELRNYDEDENIVFCNDNGYTYGYVSSNDVDIVSVETKEEEEERERKEQEEEDREEEEATMQEVHEELTDLQARYENPTDDEHLTDEEYKEEREDIFYTYGVTEELYNAWLNR